MSEIKSNPKMPKGIAYIVGNEAAERFSYYGMRALLAGFMVEYLYMTESQASDWVHNFGSAVYFLPLVGAIVADVFWGKYKTILSLSVVYCLGHIVLAVFETQTGLFAGLTLIAIGSGGIKPCVSAHVGDQFGDSNKELISKVYGYFYLSINLGALAAGLLSPYMMEHYGPSVAFGIPGLLMILATFVFYIGRNKYVHIPPRPKEFLGTLMSKEGMTAIGKLALIYVFVSFFWALFDQAATSWYFQATDALMDKYVDLGFWGFELSPKTISTSVNPLFILLLIPLFTIFIYPLLSRVISLTPLRKVYLGMFVAAASFVIMASAEGYIMNGIGVSFWWQVAGYLVITIAEVFISVSMIEFAYTQAPNEIKSLVAALSLFAVSLGNQYVSIFNGFNKEEIVVSCVKPGVRTEVNFESYVPLKGEKFEVQESDNLYMVALRGESIDTVPVTGTYRIEESNTRKEAFVLIKPDRTILSSFQKKDQKPTVSANVQRFKGPNYFYFWAALMAIVGLFFIPVAETYKIKTYIQDKLD